MGCGSPGGVNQPTRTPRAHRFVIGVAVEEPIASGTRPAQPERGRIETAARDVARWVPRTRTSVHYAFTDRVAVGLQGNVVFSLQALGSWNVLRSRWLDATLRAGTGYEQCAILTSRLCQQDTLANFVFHAEALGSLGFNPTPRVTVQLTAGPILQRGGDTRALLWSELDAYVFVSRDVGLGPTVLVLPRWLPDGRWVVAPAVSLVVYPGHGNPYLP